MLAPPSNPDAHMEVLSPKSANLPVKQRDTMQKTTKEARPRSEEKPVNPDRIDDKWRPPIIVTEPGQMAQTYAVGRKLGKGGFAVCFEGRTQATGEVFALKVVKAKVEQKKMMEKFRTEMQIHAKMRHPNIVEFYRAFSLENHTYVVLELCCSGSLTDMVKARSCLSLPEVRRFMVQICGGVKYMHKRNVIHRDLKMGNIFLDTQINIKIGDFGLAAVMADDNDRRTTLCGTPNYIAPEILSKSGSRGHDSKVDTWAIGIICYAMLVGVPPFQSKTQQEIYSRLRSLDYEWKVDCKNYIPQEAKDLVASCLNLVAAERPEMDDLVEHAFFKVGAIADVLDQTCLRAKPPWLLEADPRGDKVRSGYGITHDRVCAESGVGKRASGKPRPAAGEKANISALMEIEAENRQGCAPITPLPEGILYRQFTDPEPPKRAFQRPATVSARSVSQRPIDEAREILSGVSARPSAAMSARQQSAARPIQSFAAQQRQQAVPTASIERPPSSDSNGLLRARPVRAASSRSEKIQLPVSASTSTRTHSRKHSETERPGSDDVMQTKPKTMTTAAAAAEPAPADALKSRIARPRSVVSQDRPTIARPRSAASSSSSDLSSSNEGQRRPLRPTAGNTAPRSKTKLEPTVSVTEIGEQIERDLCLEEGYVPPPTRASFKARMITDRERYTQVHGTSHTHLMRSLRDLCSSLDPSQPRRTSRPRGEMNASASYPRVEKWVDYATKHGIAYLLTDGSLGMILKSREDDGIASSCVVMRHAKRHSERRSRGKEQQYVPQGPGVSDIEFYEQSDAAEAMRRLDAPPSDFRLDMDKYETQSAAGNALLGQLKGSAGQRLKEVGLLDKFGKYMHKQIGSADTFESTSDEAVGHFIHFYQRLGNVGVWRFADGGLQFNFPDHTKLIIYQGHSVLSEAETLVDVIYLEPRDAKDLSSYGQVTQEALERRDMKTFRLEDIQQKNLRRSEQEIIRTNEIAEKLEWVRALVGCWIREGGLGWTGEEKLGWSGLQEWREERKVKLQWVTVGRPGGDRDTMIA